MSATPTSTPSATERIVNVTRPRSSSATDGLVADEVGQADDRQDTWHQEPEGRQEQHLKRRGARMRSSQKAATSYSRRQ